MKQEILLIDDDQMLNFIHSKIVSSQFPDATLHIFKNGKEALEYIENHSSNQFLVLLDINMPIMNGWEFLNGLESLNNIKVQIHILSSSIDKIDKDKAAQHKFVASYIIKPLKKESLDDLNISKLFSA